jgi:DNA-binding MarR family transcriptional regulator
LAPFETIGGKATISAFGREATVEESEWDFKLGYLIHDVSRLRRIVFDRTLAPLGITRSQWWVVEFVSRNDGLPQTRLASELDVGKVALGSLIDRLESAGFVVRGADLVDRRLNRIYLTTKARQFLDRIRQEARDFDAKILKDVHEEELRSALRVLLAMKCHLLALYERATRG